MNQIIQIHSPLLSHLLTLWRIAKLESLIRHTSDMGVRAYLCAAHRELARRLATPADREVQRRANWLAGVLNRPIFTI